MFDKCGKCGPIFKILHQAICKKIFYVHITKISTSPAMLLLYFVKVENQKCYQIFTLNVTINRPMFN